MPDWFYETVTALPAVLWMIVGVGLPAALALLPRTAWRDRPFLALCAIAFGAALTTAWMFVLGTIGGATGTPLLTPTEIGLGMIRRFESR